MPRLFASAWLFVFKYAKYERGKVPIFKHYKTMLTPGRDARSGRTVLPENKNPERRLKPYTPENYAYERASCRIRTNDPEITNHVLWPTELKRRVGKLLASRRYNQLPLLRSRPGGFEGSWPCKTCPSVSVCKVSHFPPSCKLFITKNSKIVRRHMALL